MSKSTSMLPSLAGGSGVAAHALTDADLMKVVDAVTLNADRDRKVTLSELGEHLRPHSNVARATAVAPNTLSQSVSGVETVATLDLAGLPKGIWEVSAWLQIIPATSEPLVVPKDVTMQVFQGTTKVKEYKQEFAQKFLEASGSSVAHTVAYANLNPVYIDTTTGSESMSLKVWGTVGTFGGDTFTVATGLFKAERVWFT